MSKRVICPACGTAVSPSELKPAPTLGAMAPITVVDVRTPDVESPAVAPEPKGKGKGKR